LGDTTLHNIATPGPKRKQQEKGLQAERVGAIQKEGLKGRTISAPARMANVTADLTGMTGLLATPARGGEFGSLGKNGEVGGDAAGKSKG
jgi:hypothetical protein